MYKVGCKTLAACRGFVYKPAQSQTWLPRLPLHFVQGCISTLLKLSARTFPLVKGYIDRHWAQHGLGVKSFSTFTTNPSY